MKIVPLFQVRYDRSLCKPLGTISDFSKLKGLGTTDFNKLKRSTSESHHENSRSPSPVPQQTIDSKIRKERILMLLECSNIYPFRWMKNLFICMQCGQSYSDPAKLREHFNEHKDNKLSNIKLGKLKNREYLKVDITDAICKICDTPIERLNDLMTHLSEKHQKNFDLKSDLKILPFKLKFNDYRCVVCDEKYTEFKLLKQHMNVHYSNFICATCGSGFITQDRLKVHVFSHETGSYPCEECGKVFHSIRKKKQHYAIIHKLVKRHRCPQCPETFRSYYQRMKHVSSIHGGKIKEYKCELCPRLFTMNAKLDIHVRDTHLKEKRYNCQICEWKFYSKYKLKDHMIKHSGERKYQCNVCMKAYSRKFSLSEHMRIHEND